MLDEQRQDTCTDVWGCVLCPLMLWMQQRRRKQRQHTLLPHIHPDSWAHLQCSSSKISNTGWHTKSTSKIQQVGKKEFLRHITKLLISWIIWSLHIYKMNGRIYHVCETNKNYTRSLSYTKKSSKYRNGICCYSGSSAIKSKKKTN